MILLKIIKYKKGKNGKYLLIFDNGNSLSLYEEIILQYDLLIHKEITDNLLSEIVDANFKYDVYYIALKTITAKAMSIFELRFFLLKKEYPENLIDDVIDILCKQGYLNDSLFTKSYINSQINTSTNGPIKIINDLENKRIDRSIIDKEISIFDYNIQKEKIDKIINKMIKSNHDKSGNALKQKIFTYLVNKGYESSIINGIIDVYDFELDKKSIKREYDKMFKKYSKKYQGEMLEKVIKEKLCLKGIIYEEE